MKETKKIHNRVHLSNWVTFAGLTVVHGTPGLIRQLVLAKSLVTW